jgi:hypothetical protein
MQTSIFIAHRAGFLATAAAHLAIGLVLSYFGYCQ